MKAHIPSLLGEHPDLRPHSILIHKPVLCLVAQCSLRGACAAEKVGLNGKTTSRPSFPGWARRPHTTRRSLLVRCNRSETCAVRLFKCALCLCRWGGKNSCSIQQTRREGEWSRRATVSWRFVTQIDNVVSQRHVVLQERKARSFVKCSGAVSWKCSLFHPGQSRPEPHLD